MIRIKGFHRPEIVGAKGTQIAIESDEFLGGGNDIRYLLVDGFLETYMEFYKLPADVCFSVMMLDAFYDDVDVPLTDDPLAKQKFMKISKLAEQRIVWQCDKSLLMATATIDGDGPASEPETSKQIKRAREFTVAAFQRRQEELLGDSMVGDLVAERSKHQLQNSDKWARNNK